MNIWEDIEQGSEAWLNLRVGKITASRFKDARDRLKPAKGETEGKPSAKCTGYAAQVAVERIACRPVDKVFENWQMREGKEQEPIARAAYDVETGHIVKEVGAISTDDDLFLYSPDGLIGDDGLLEIKTLLSADVILNVIGRGDLSAYMDQCLGGLWLTGRKWIDLVLWAPALEPIGKALTIHRIHRDEDAIQALEDDLMAFRQMVLDAETLLRGQPANDPAPEFIEEDQAPPPTAVVLQMPTPTPTAALAAPAGPPNLKLGEIGTRLGFTMTAEFVRSMGIEPEATEKAAKLYTEAQFQTLCDSLVAHVRTAAAKHDQPQAA